MPAWEFTVEQFSSNDRKEKLAETLTMAAANGAEFAGTVHPRPGAIWLIFRRPKQGPPTS